MMQNRKKARILYIEYFFDKRETKNGHFKIFHAQISSLETVLKDNTRNQ